ncbi:translation termination factor GTPase eRF3 [Coemansia sp. RSA 353]|nr:translation termination factor GTPase eRF3 [Coemansia sp. RSA 562]KAJ2174663.1 translation termination factor GTPase eRF3 [Coemansia sp. RSA 560]KAJ2187755.1 translation termination factor GTPase eRF3 [Coemansia sp. RSA 532]KAJ2229232.1 translation termination factor GTPase eRF3 [Coemansia sp. RSA 518]KAJ2276981.1 translation termination factor GTPase eRF3 [Coemansia sp. RSA 371]KAJ2293337.1 translation termination factor GTPase eRF3 [Coemansia sp. RSA 355]KAJ2300092.1 translation terminat
MANQQDNVDDVTKKTGEMSLNVGAKAFVPKFNVKAPAFAPRKAAQPAAPVAAAPTEGAGVAKPMTISIGGSSSNNTTEAVAVPKPATISIGEASTSQAPAATDAAPAAEPTPAESSVDSPAPENPAIEAATNEVAVEEEEEEDDDELFNEHTKEHTNVIFIGHVDAGKSTLGGNILFLTGMVDKRTMEKYEREAKEAGRDSWYLSWALDTNQEERAKGKTVECGRAFFETDKRRYTILDAPGHKNFVPSMVGGAAQADVAVLVISARRGEFETGFERGGQTREHAVLVKTAGVRTLIVAINKMDDPTVGWDKARYDEVTSKLTPFLKKTGYSPKTDIIYIPMSGYTGAGVKDRVGSACSWYTGPSLLETLDGLQSVERKTNGPLRIPISEKYRDMGTIVSGKIESGRIRINQKMMLMPEKHICEVSNIYGANEAEEKTAISGDNVRIKLRGIDDGLVQNGHVLVDLKHPCHITREFDALLIIREAKNIITSGYKSVLHVHTATEEVILSKLLHKVNAKNQRSRAPPPFIKQNEKCIVRIQTTKPICVERFEDFPQLGRFTLRDEGKTIAVGKILKLVETNTVNAAN